MSLSLNDDLEKLLGSEFKGERCQDWIWHYLINIGANLGEAYFGASARGHLAIFLRGNENFLERVRFRLGSAFLPDHLFDWLDDSAWQSDFVFDVLRRRLTLHKKCVHPSLSGRRRIIALIDGWDGLLMKKEIFIKEIKETWLQRVEADRVFKWFEGDDEIARCQLLWEWLTIHRSDLAKGKKALGCYQDLLFFLDGVQIPSSDKELMVIKVRKQWDQRRRRQKLEGVKRQCNLELYDRTVLLLDKLAGKHGLSRSAIVDLLINDEYTKGAYIPERLRRIEALSVDVPMPSIQAKI